MKENFDLSSATNFKQFSEVILQVLNSTVNSLIGVQANFVINALFRGSPSDIITDFPDGVLIKGIEQDKGYEFGMLSSLNDISILSDMMLLGDGVPKKSLDPDLSDAIKEISGQIFSGISIPFEDKTGIEVDLKVDTVSPFTQNLLTEPIYVVISFSGTLKNAPIVFSFYLSQLLFNLVDDYKDKIDTSSFFASIPQSSPSHSSGTSGNMDMLLDVDIPISVKMGSARLFLKDILGLGPGNIVELDQNADEAIELMVNNKLIARGEVVIVDGYFGFRIKEIVSKAERIKKLKD